MATIRPDQLPTGALTDTAAFIADIGSNVIKVQPSDIVDKVAPVASESEAILGINNTKRMTPLRVRQAIAVAESSTNIFVRSTRLQIASLSFAHGIVAFLSEGITRSSSGRAGEFMAVVGNFSAEVASDPLQGIYIAPLSDPTGGSGAWVRVWDWVNGRPEWFGAVTNAGGDEYAASNLSAIHECIKLCPATQLQSADYWISTTLKITTQYRTIRGSVQSTGYGSSGTRILSRDGTKDVIQIGPDDAPIGGVNAFYRGITVENITARWDAPFLVLAPLGSESTAPKCFNYKFLLGPQFKNLAAWECQLGHYMHACVTPKFYDCTAFRSHVYNPSGYDFFRGFWLRGDPQVLAGGNASVFLEGCNVSVGGDPPNTIGFYMNGSFADTYLIKCETSQLHQALVFDGGGGAGNGMLDCHIIMPIFDQCKFVGVDLVNFNELATLSFVGGYIQCRSSATHAMWIRGGPGSVALTGGLQLLGSDGGGAPGNIGIGASGQQQLIVDQSVTIKEFAYPVVLDGVCGDGYIAPTIFMSSRPPGLRYAAVYVGNCFRMKILPSVRARPGTPAFSTGILFTDDDSSRCLVECTGIDPSAVGNAIFINSVNITAPGWYKSDGSAGSEADKGIEVRGFVG